MLEGNEVQKAEKASAQLRATPESGSVEHFQKYVVSYSSALHNDYSLYSKAGNRPRTMWSEVSTRRVRNRNINQILVQSWGARGVRVMKSATNHPMTGMGNFARLKLSNGNVVRYHKGTLFYIQLYGKRHEHTFFGKEVLLASKKDFEINFCIYQRE